MKALSSGLEAPLDRRESNTARFWSYAWKVVVGGFTFSWGGTGNILNIPTVAALVWGAAFIDKWFPVLEPYKWLLFLCIGVFCAFGMIREGYRLLQDASTRVESGAQTRIVHLEGTLRQLAANVRAQIEEPSTQEREILRNSKASEVLPRADTHLNAIAIASACIRSQMEEAIGVGIGRIPEEQWTKLWDRSGKIDCLYTTGAENFNKSIFAPKRTGRLLLLDPESESTDRLIGDHPSHSREAQIQIIRQVSKAAKESGMHVRWTRVNTTSSLTFFYGDASVMFKTDIVPGDNPINRTSQRIPKSDTTFGLWESKYNELWNGAREVTL